jgi:hypothetical protein
MSFEHKLVKLMETSGKSVVLSTLDEAIQTKKFDPTREFSIRRLAEACYGYDWAEELKKKRLYESPEAVSASAFPVIQGQILLSIIKDAYKLQPTVGDKLVTTIGVTNQNLAEEQVGYVSSPFDIGASVEEMEPFPATQVKGQYVTLPRIKKWGSLMHLSFESVYQDKTAQLIKQAQMIGQQTALNKEFEILNTVLGFSNTYKFNGTSINTYNAAPNANFVNKLSSFSITDWQSVNALEQTVLRQRDPVSGLPVELLTKKQVIVPPQSLYKVKTILNATQVRQGPFAQSGEPIGTYANNPLDAGQYEVISSIYIQRVLEENGYTYDDQFNWMLFGNCSGAFMYREARPLEVVSLPQPSVYSLESDIIMSIRATLMGSCGVYEPRCVCLGDPNA